ncbi:MAG: DUF924 domain-containing protein [Myxococcales bacterium]|nr:DUF924 domain-containing protein [Myxococcales bacterium]
MTPAEVVRYWFGDWDDRIELASDDAQIARWWSADPTIDAEIRERFSGVHARVAAGELRAWEEQPVGLLACVLVLDQFSRVLFRGHGDAFAHDTAALQLTRTALQKAWDRDLTPIQRAFLYLPLMHAEDRAAHRRALALYQGLAEEVEELGLARADYYRRVVNYEVRHKEIIDRFGRYPHRNFPLERTSTPEELDFIDRESPF